jgi:hypothetical protein
MGKTMRRTAALLLVAVLAVLAACGSDGGDGMGGDLEATRPPGFTASPAYLSQVIEASESAPLRFAGTITVSPMGVEDLEAVTGASDGHRTSSVMDMSALFAEIADSGETDLPFDPDEVDLSIETVTDGDTVYLRAPGFAEIADELPNRNNSPLTKVVAVLGDSWGRLQLSDLGDDVDSQALFSQLNEGQNLQPGFYLDLMKASDDVEDLGSDTVDGDSMVGLAADVPFVALLEAQGIDPASIVAESSYDNAAEAVEAFTLPIEIWLDDVGQVRVLEIDIGAGFDRMADEMGEDGLPDGYEFTTVIRFTDHGDDSIVIEVPDEADTIDLTETVKDL